jgi:hypothetical protein
MRTICESAHLGKSRRFLRRCAAVFEDAQISVRTFGPHPRWDIPATGVGHGSGEKIADRGQNSARPKAATAI